MVLRVTRASIRAQVWPSPRPISRAILPWRNGAAFSRPPSIGIVLPAAPRHFAWMPPSCPVDSTISSAHIVALSALISVSLQGAETVGGFLRAMRRPDPQSPRAADHAIFDEHPRQPLGTWAVHASSWPHHAILQSLLVSLRSQGRSCDRCGAISLDEVTQVDLFTSGCLRHSICTANGTSMICSVSCMICFLRCDLPHRDV